MKTFAIKPVFISAILLMAVTACSPSTETTALAAKVVARSPSNSGGPIQISHRLPALLIVEQEVTVNVSFQLEPYQHLEVAINDSEHFQLLGSAVSVLEGTHDGLINMSVRLIPVHSGKSYLKLIAGTVDGEKMRSYAIRLDVTDQAGRMPEKQAASKQRIDLPSQLSH